MRRRVFLPLILAIFAGAAQAQDYRERVTYPVIGIGGSNNPHDSPRTDDLSSYYANPSPADFIPGSVTVTFVSTPAPSVLAWVQPTGGRTTIVAGELFYRFFYSGPALSYVPINFLGLFNLQHGLALFNRSEVGVYLDTNSVGGIGGQSASMQFNCAQTCRLTSLTASNLSSIQAPFTASNAATGSDSSSASGSFSGTLMGATDANGHGRGSINLNAFASSAGSRPSWAFIDPALTIDASYLAAHPEATLTLPAGVGNEITAVPEPQALLLMLAGLGALALRGRAV